MAKQHLTRDLEHLQRQILVLAGKAEEAVTNAAHALLNNDIKLAQSVVATDTSIDELENSIQEECLKILALHQPVAGDLRRIATVFSITTDLERIGDLAVDVAERAIAIAHNPLTLLHDSVRRLSDFVAGMVRQAHDAFVNLDSRLAMRVIRLDDEADRMHAELIQQIIKLMKENPAHVDAGVSLFSVARHLERIGDHATNIAEDVVYLVDGEIVRHRPESMRTQS